MDIKIPIHIAIIMDGNGRWAKQQGKKRTYGHYIGSLVLDDITKAAVKLGVQYLTLYTFSTENWKRPKSEVNFLIALLKRQLPKKENLFKENDVRFNVIGDLSVFDEILKNKLKHLMDETKGCSAMILTLALNYGGKREIVQAAKKLAIDVNKGKIDISQINEFSFQKFLYTYNMPDVDLLIRTGGEKRISNFLLWQSSYAEFVFFDKYWPEFTPEDLIDSIKEFNKRQRKFGGL